MNKKDDDTYEVRNAELPEVYNVPRPWYSTDFVADLLSIDVLQKQYQNTYNLTEKEIQQQIDNDNPFAVLYGYYDENGKWCDGHWCLVVGYIEFMDSSDVNRYIRINPDGGIMSSWDYNGINQLPGEPIRNWENTAY